MCNFHYMTESPQKYSKLQLEEAIKTSLSLRETCQKLSIYCGSKNCKRIKDRSAGSRCPYVCPDGRTIAVAAKRSPPRWLASRISIGAPGRRAARSATTIASPKRAQHRSRCPCVQQRMIGSRCRSPPSGREPRRAAEINARTSSIATSRKRRPSGKNTTSVRPVHVPSCAISRVTTSRSSTRRNSSELSSGEKPSDASASRPQRRLG